MQATAKQMLRWLLKDVADDKRRKQVGHLAWKAFHRVSLSHTCSDPRYLHSYFYGVQVGMWGCVGVCVRVIPLWVQTFPTRLRPP